MTTLHEKTLLASFKFLEELRTSGEVNMFASRPYLARAMDLDKAESMRVLTAWMKHYDSDASVVLRRAREAGDLA